jgi:hypothetical protein
MARSISFLALKPTSATTVSSSACSVKWASITPMLSDPTDVFDTPADGEFRMYAGGTTMDEVKDAPNGITTILLQPTQLEKTKKLRRKHLEPGSTQAERADGCGMD